MNLQGGRLRGRWPAFWVCLHLGVLICEEIPAAGERRVGGEIAALIEAGRHAEAEELARSHLERSHLARSPAEDESADGESAEILVLLVRALVYGGKASTEEARLLARRALSERERTLGPEHPEVARSLDDLAFALYSNSDHETALEHATRALEIRRRALGKEHPETAESLNNLAFLYEATGEYEKADPLYRQSLKIREEILGERHLKVAESLNNLALLQEAVGEYEAAERHHRRALVIYEEQLGREHPLLATSLNNLALLLREKGEFSEALSLLEEALALREAMFGAVHPAVAQSLDNLSVLLQDMGDHARARPLVERALGIREGVFGADHPRIAGSLNNLATLLRDTGDTKAAEGIAERALALVEGAYGPGHPHLATALHNLGLLRLMAGDASAARPLFERSLAIRRAALGEEHPHVARSFEVLGRTAWRLGDATRARVLLVRSLAARRAAFGHDHPRVARSLLSLAQFRLESGEVEGALQAAVDAENLRRQHVRVTIRGLGERQALRFADGSGDALDIACSAALRYPPGVSAAFSALVRSRALVLDEMIRRFKTPARESDPEIRRAWERLRSARQRLANLVVRGPQSQPASSYRPRVEKARREKELAERELGLRSAAFRRLRARDEIDAPDVLRALPAGSVLLSYARFERRPSSGVEAPRAAYLAFVARAGEKRPTVVDLGAAAGIDGRVAAWREQLVRFSEHRYRRAGERLREALWDPVASLIAGVRRLYVVPDGALHTVDFAALPGASGGYLIDRDTVIQYLSAERDLVGRSSREGVSAQDLLVFGGVDFGLATSPGPGFAASDRQPAPDEGCPALAALRFDPLPGSRGEALDIAELWRRERPGSTVRHLTGRAASEAAFKDLAPSHRALHLATHGFFLGDGCDARAPARRPAQPLLMSGLALAGANDRARASLGEDDGLLTSEEIAALDLSGVDGVVLSACETGIGRAQSGEGVLGLRRALRLAGAGTLVLGLWQVDDSAARTWMRAYYEGLLTGGLDAAAAGHAASRRGLAARRAAGKSTHPSHWGGFIVEGP